MMSFKAFGNYAPVSFMVQCSCPFWNEGNYRVIGHMCLCLCVCYHSSSKLLANMKLKFCLKSSTQLKITVITFWGQLVDRSTLVQVKVSVSLRQYNSEMVDRHLICIMSISY